MYKFYTIIVSGASAGVMALCIKPIPITILSNMDKFWLAVCFSAMVGYSVRAICAAIADE